MHRRKTSNALNASVRCKQKRRQSRQRLSETVPTPTAGFRKLLVKVV